MEVSVFFRKFAAKERISMEFIAIFFGLCALGFLLVGFGAFALYFVKGIITILGAIYNSARWLIITTGKILVPLEKR